MTFGKSSVIKVRSKLDLYLWMWIRCDA